MEKIVQYVVCHCDWKNKLLKNRTPLFVAKEKKKDISDGCVTWKDDNIDYLNKFYCELTAMYWVWKNVQDIDYVSIEHYRRVFVNKGTSLFFYSTLDDKKISKIFSSYSIILPRKHHFLKNMYKQYADYHYIEDIDIVRRIIEKKHNKYLPTFDEYFMQNESTLYNMCIMKKDKFNEYCSFAFDILDDVFVEIKDKIECRNSYQQRVIGFLAERLFNVWVRYNFDEKQIYYCSVGRLDQNCFINNVRNYVNKLLKKEYDI